MDKSWWLHCLTVAISEFQLTRPFHVGKCEYTIQWESLVIESKSSKRFMHRFMRWNTIWRTTIGNESSNGELSYALHHAVVTLSRFSKCTVITILLNKTIFFLSPLDIYFSFKSQHFKTPLNLEKVNRMIESFWVKISRWIHIRSNSDTSVAILYRWAKFE